MAKRNQNIFYGGKNAPGQLSESTHPDDGNLQYQDRSMQAFVMERRSVSELPRRPRRAGGDSCRSQRVVAVTGGGDGGRARAYRTCKPSNRREGRRSGTAPGSRPLPLFLGSGRTAWLAIKRWLCSLFTGCRHEAVKRT